MEHHAYIDTMTVYEGYNSISETDTVISFTAPSTITHADVDWDEAGYRVGMKIVITGANEATNNATFDITAITNNEITISQTTLTTKRPVLQSPWLTTHTLMCRRTLV